MNVNSCFTMNYEQNTMNNEPKNKAKTNPNKAKQTQPVMSEPVLSIVERVEPSVICGLSFVRCWFKPEFFNSYKNSLTDLLNCLKCWFYYSEWVLSMKSFMAKKGEVEPKWLLVDAEGAVLGRMAARIAPILMGKTKPTYTPHVDVGDYVVVVNADKIKVTGKKAQQKEYDYYTYHPGGHKYVSFADMMAKKPEKVIELAVRRMLPKNRLGRAMLKKLKVYRGPEHDHQAQKPEKIELF